MNLASWIILGILAVAVFFALRYVWRSTRNGGCMDCPVGKEGECFACPTLDKMQADLEKFDQQSEDLP